MAFADLPSHEQIEQSIRMELHARKTPTFNALLSRWQAQYGSSAVLPLLNIASDTRASDPDRYVGLMGAAKLGGRDVATALLPFLKDHSWMIRSGTLRALSVLQDPKTAPATLPLLKDPALVVRVEAVEAVKSLRPDGSESALVAAALDPLNFHGGKAQWVPQRALAALVALKARTAAPRLAKLLDYRTDPALQRETVHALESILGKKLKPHAKLAEQVREWKKALKTS